MGEGRWTKRPNLGRNVPPHGSLRTNRIGNECGWFEGVPVLAGDGELQSTCVLWRSRFSQTNKKVLSYGIVLSMKSIDCERTTRDAHGAG